MKESKLFDFSEIFTSKRGKRLIEQDQIIGDIAYVSSTKNNNGISGYINPPDFMIRYHNKMTLANSGSVGYCFYHDYEFVASDHVTVIGIRDEKIQLNKYIALYLKPIFESMKYKYNFGREISDNRIHREKVMLPITSKGTPDWKYMEDYIKKLENSIKFKRINTENNNLEEININEWEEFSINEIFDHIESCKCSNAGLLIDGEDIPYIGAKKKDCGVIKFVTYDENLITKGNCIAFICDGDGSVGYSNYIEYPEFIGTTNLAVAYSKELNKYNALFLVSVLDKERQKYSFGRKYKTRIEKTKIKLPFKTINNEKVPDWLYMEKYIKELPYSDKI